MDIESCVRYLRENRRPVKIMEVCGTHTSCIAKNGLRDLLPPSIRLVSGPGCPVCVTAAGYIDRLEEYAFQPNCRVLSFGDMFKVRGGRHSLSEAKALGAGIDLIYSPLEAVELAARNPDTQYAVAAVGFETTLPVYAVLLDELVKRKIANVKLLTALKSVIPAVSYICERERAEPVDGFICPGHVCAVTGGDCYTALAEKYRRPFVIAGFEPEHILAAICGIVYQLNHGRYEAVNLYKSAVGRQGNQKALALSERYFEISDAGAVWRGIGKIGGSAYALKKEYSAFDLGSGDVAEDFVADGCRCGDVMLGRITPGECPLFGRECRPESAVGACMVSSEGACGIWYNTLKR